MSEDPYFNLSKEELHKKCVELDRERNGLLNKEDSLETVSYTHLTLPTIYPV